MGKFTGAYLFMFFLIQSEITEVYIFIYSLEKEQEKTERLTHQNQEKEDKLTDMRLKCMRYFLKYIIICKRIS